jgi:hypothetical protein
MWLIYLPYKNEYRIFNPVEITIRRGLRQKGEKWRDEPIQYIIQIHMEMSQRNSLYSYLKQTIIPFFKNKIQESCLGTDTRGKGVGEILLMYENGTC